MNDDFTEVVGAIALALWLVGKIALMAAALALIGIAARAIF